MEQLRADVANKQTLGFDESLPGLGTLPLGAVTLPSSDNKAMTASNPFIAELGLLTKLLEPRVSGKKEAASLPAPKPVIMGPGGKRQSVPPLSDSEVAHGEVQSLPGYGKLMPGQSSTGHAGLKEMQISRKARHETAIETYQKRLVQLEVELEGRTGQVARGFKQLISLNDAELATMFEELNDDFLLQMERIEVDSAWVRRLAAPSLDRAFGLCVFAPSYLELLGDETVASLRNERRDVHSDDPQPSANPNRPSPSPLRLIR